MKYKGKRLLCLTLAFAVAANFPVTGISAYAAEPDAMTPAIVSADDGSGIEKPTLPEGFCDPLEDNNGLTLADGTTTAQVTGCDTVIDVTTHWNNSSQYHASVKNAAELFQTTAFTVLLDVRQDAPTSDTNVVDQRTALTIGNTTNSLHLLTYSGKFGYGTAKDGISTNMLSLSGVEQNGWNAVAMTYEENGGNGHVVIYINGEKAGEVTDIGFKLSTMSDLSSMIARTFGTNYLQQGRYDNIVVGNTVLDEETAKAETAYRKYAKEHLPADTSLLEKYINQADASIAAGFTSDSLETALNDAKTLLAGKPEADAQSSVDAAAQALLSEIEKTSPNMITIKGSDVDSAAQNMNGLTYKGFGMLNGNSTSNLLLDYKSKSPETYNEMMEFLFGGEYPLFTHIKMEMGNDGNNSTGAEACTMRYEDEEADASRSPGFVMAADAKKINPDVKISILRWEMPGWVSAKWSKNTNNEGYEAMYKWYKETIFDAYEKYGYMVDFVNPDKNETGNPDTAFIKWFSNRIKNESDFPNYMDEKAQDAYRNIRIIASDENKGLKIVPYMRADEELYNAVDIIGFHYRTNATDDYVTMADVDDKEVWYSEGCATFGYTELQENKTSSYGYESIGGYQSPLALMDSFITAFDSSRRTHYMFQPAIGSFYEGIQYGHKELLSARDPWSGYIHYDPALYMLQHFAKFAKTGWEDSDPTQNDIWRVIPSATDGAFEGSENEHNTAGIDGNAGYMTLASPDKENFSVVFVNNTQNEKSFYIGTEDMADSTTKDLNLWVTETDNYMQNKGTVEKRGNGWYLTLPAYSVATATTLDTEPERAPVDDIHNEDRDVLDTDATGGTNGVTNDNVLYADNFEYEEEADDYLASRGNEPRYMLDTHGAWVVENGALKQELSSSVGQWNSGEPSTIVGDFRWMDYTTSVDIQIPEASSSTYARLTVRSQSGMNWDNSGYTLSINGTGNWELYRIGKKVAGGTVTTNADGKYNVKIMALGNVISVVINGESVTTYQDSIPMLSGRVKLSSTWNQVYFDNLLVETVDGGIPYALSMVDGQDDCVTYEGDWTIENPGGGSADNWYRTLSTTKSANASFSFPINGSGFAILGTNDGTAKLDVYVDNTLAAENAATIASPVRGETYSLADLESGVHTIKVVVKSGTLNIDALYTLGERLEADSDTLISVIADNLPSIPAITSDGSIDGLPKQVEVLTITGETVTKDIVWNISENQFEGKDFEEAYVTGTVQDGVNPLGLPLTASVPVEMVVPAGTVYFIDSVDAAPAANATTESFAAVKALLGNQLLNQVSDQLKTSSNSWGLVDTDAGTKGYTDTTDKTATGLYGHNNEKGETLSYAFTLPAGDYKLTSAHREWWGMTRPMSASLTINNKTTNAGTIDLSGSSGDIIHTVNFSLDSEQLVTYTLTATGTQAPVISWLAVSKAAPQAEHVHSYSYKDNGNGTHTAACQDGDDSFTQAHTYVNDVCTLCGAKKPPETHTHKYTYKDNGNGTHTATCTAKDSTYTENHTYKNDVCTLCGAKKPVTLSKPVISSLTNASKGITVKWNKVSGAAGYYIYRKAGSGSFKKVKTTASTSWTDTKANKNGTKYQYKIYAYKGSTKSKVSATKTTYRLAAINFTSAKNIKGKKLQLKWKKNAKASGYEIQYSTNSKFSKAKTLKISGKKKVLKTISKLKKGKKYSVRIRCYKSVGKTKYYSGWSKVKKVKISK